MIDYSRIPARHDYINLRLEQWGRWITSKPSASCAPMFREYRSLSRQWEMPILQSQGLPMDHLEIERAVSILPDKHRTAIRWAYAYPWVPVNRVRRELGLTRDALNQLLNDGRDMLVNRLKTTMIDKSQSGVI